MKLKQLLTALVFSCLLLHSRPVQAQTLSLSLWPPVFTATVEPGRAVTQAFTLKNLGDETMVSARIVPFEPSGLQGHIVLSETPSPASGFFSLQNPDLNLPGSFKLEPGQVKALILKITVPETAAEADHYLALVLETDSQELITGSGSKTLTSLAANILLTVSSSAGVNPAARIERFQTKQLFDSFEPFRFALIVKNTGPHWLKAVGQIEIKNWFQQTVATLALREDNVLGLSSRQLLALNQWQPLFPFGRYSATVTITPKDTTNTISQTLFFFIFPYQLVAALLLAFICYQLIWPKLSKYIKRLQF